MSHITASSPILPITSNPSNFSQHQSMYLMAQHQYGQWFPGGPRSYQHQTMTPGYSPPYCNYEPNNYNPFLLRFASGNIRVCQSCHCNLRAADGTVPTPPHPTPPHDLCVARLGKRPYFNSSTGSWCTPSKETNSHYCAKMGCLTFCLPFLCLHLW